MAFHIAAQRSRGSSHRKSHTPCQDSCRVGRVFPDPQAPADGRIDLIVGAVADGGGSRPLSHIGARLTVSLALSSMRSAWNPQTMQRASPADLEIYWRRLCEDCRRVLQLEAEARGFVDGDGAGDRGPFACTLVAFMATRDRLVAAQVGDGFLVLGRPDPAAGASGVTSLNYALAFQNRVTEYASQVIWLTASNWKDDLRTCVLDGPVALVVASSDGMEKAVLQSSPARPGELSPYAGYVDQLAEGCRQTVEETRATGAVSQSAMEDYLFAVLTSPQLEDRTDDDKSMALAIWLDQNS
jgi:hypothetical protein